MGFRNEGFPERDPGWKGTRISVRQQAAASACRRVCLPPRLLDGDRLPAAAMLPAVATLPGRGDATRQRRCYLKVDGTESVVS